MQNFYKNHAIDNAIWYICDKKYEYFLSKKNVQGIGLGYKIKNGICSFQKCIKVFVSKKLPINKIEKSSIIPSYYNNIITDVVESGYFKPCGLTSKVRPTLCGYSIGPIGFNASGTLGCLVRNKCERSFYILGCNHVLTQLEKAKFGTPIVQPGVCDGGDFRKDVIANLHRYVQIRYSGMFSKPVNFVDAAIARISDISLTSTTMAIINKDIKDIGKAKLGENVFKIGRTTGLTKGHVSSIHVTQMINYSKGKALFKEQVISNIASEDGDSGSILLNDNMYALGMLIGNSYSADYGVFSDIKNNMNLLNVEIVKRKRPFI